MPPFVFVFLTFAYYFISFFRTSSAFVGFYDEIYRNTYDNGTDNYKDNPNRELSSFYVFPHEVDFFVYVVREIAHDCAAVYSVFVRVLRGELSAYRVGVNNGTSSFGKVGKEVSEVN